jgi:hypothetical protein
MRRKHLVIITVVALMVMFGIISQASAQVTKKYTNKVKGFSINFPAKWEIKEKVSGVDVIALSPLENSADRFRENINVIAVKVPTNVTLKVFYDANVKDMKKNLKKFTVISETNTKINGNGAKKLVYSHKMYNHIMKASAYVIANNGKAFFITCTAAPATFAKWDAAFDKIAKSMKY